MSPAEPSPSSTCHARILSAASALPERAFDNRALIERYGLSVHGNAIDKIFGARERRVAEPAVVDSDLLAEAARRCLSLAGVRAEQLSKLIVNKFLGDRLLPMTAAYVQRKLGARVAYQALDVDGGSNSFMQALELASHAIRGGDEYVLIAAGGLSHCLQDTRDVRHVFTHGDGAAAVLLGRAEQPHFEAFYQFSRPEYAGLALGFRMRAAIPSNAAELADHERFYRLYEAGDPKATWDATLDAYAQLARGLLQKSGLLPSQVELWLLGESHHRLWRAVLERLEVTPERALSLFHEYGDTRSATLPLLLSHAQASGRVGPGSRVMLLSVGEGLSAAGAIARL